MNAKEVQKFVLRYLEATECHITEKSPAHVTVRLSPEADKDLTNRPFYWSFVERTGAPPETMTMTFVFDPEARAAGTGTGVTASASGPPTAPAPGAPGTPGAAGAAAGGPAGRGATAVPGAAGASTGPAAGSGASGPASPPSSAAQQAQASVAAKPPEGDSILGRYFGFAPAPATTGRIPFDEMTYGSRRLEQLFGVVRGKGRYVQMFEDVKAPRGAPPAVCNTWLNVNYKVEFCCDMKRDELHSLGISLMTGEIVEEFNESLAALPLTPRLPANTLVQRPVWSINRAVAAVEAWLEKEIRAYNHDWASDAKARLEDELTRVDEYYGDLLPALDDPEQRAAAAAQYEARKREIEWQYAPRITANVVGAGMFHLSADTQLWR
ncbi:YqhG family protein [Paenibacillus sp. TRM 82003]|nr:YqhG family protein [Paenibacillus sp. TRM 82003]